MEISVARFKQSLTRRGRIVDDINGDFDDMLERRASRRERDAEIFKHLGCLRRQTAFHFAVRVHADLARNKNQFARVGRDNMRVPVRRRNACGVDELSVHGLLLGGGFERISP